MAFHCTTQKTYFIGLGALFLASLSCGESSPTNTGAGGSSKVEASSAGGAGQYGAGHGGQSSGGGAGSHVSSTSAKGGNKGTGGATGAGGELENSKGGAGPGAGGSRAGGSNAGSHTGGSNQTGGSNAGGSTAGSNAGGSTPGSDAGTSGGSSNTGGSTGGGDVTCPSTKLSAGDSNKTVSVGGTSRTYILHIPSAYKGDAPAPLIIDFHGITGSGSQEKGSSTYPKTVDSEGVVMAFPDGKSGPMGNAWNVGPCCVDNVDDIAFSKALVADVQKVACIDPKRVYAVGFSMGGGMSHYIGCHAADVFAAIAPAAFDLLEENVDDCKPARPITVFSFRGTSDSIVPYSGGYSNVVSGHPITFLGAVNTFKKWAELNKCTGSAVDGGGGCQTYSQCEGGVEVTLCTKQSGNHEGGDATKSWPVLKKHTLP